MKDIVVFPFLLLLLFVSAGGAAGIALRQERGVGSSEGNRIQHIDASSSSSFLFSSFEKKRPQKQAIEWDDEEIEGHDDVLEKDYFKGDGGEERLQKIDSVDTVNKEKSSDMLLPFLYTINKYPIKVLLPFEADFL